MSSDFLAFVDARRAKIRKQIQKLESALVELDKSEKLFRQSQKSVAKRPGSELGQAAMELNYSEKAPSKIAQGLNLSMGGQTIKEAVTALLDKFPDGLTAEEILAKLKSGSMPGLVRSSLSPQLSRLRHADRVVTFMDGRWFLGGEGTSAEAERSPPSVFE